MIIVVPVERPVTFPVNELMVAIEGKLLVQVPPVPLMGSQLYQVAPTQPAAGPHTSTGKGLTVIDAAPDMVVLHEEVVFVATIV